jgi:hypothetical protein
MMTTIFINGEQMDAPDNLTISLTYRSAAFASLDKLNNSYSNTITLPRTAHNEKVLGGVVFPSSTSSLPYQYLPASVMIGGVMVVPNAVAYITEVTEDDIKVAVLWDSVVKLAAIVADGRKLNELPYDYSNDLVVWNKQNATLYPWADYGFVEGDALTTRHPVVSAESILQRICSAYDITMPEDTAFMSKWRIPLLSRIDPIITDGEPLLENNVSAWYGNQCCLVRTLNSYSNGTNYTNEIPLWFGRVGKANGTPPDSDLPDIEIPVKPVLPVTTIADDELEDFDTPIVDEGGKPTGALVPPDFVNRELRGTVGADGTNKYLEYFVPRYPNLVITCSGNIAVPLTSGNTATNAFILSNLKLRLLLLYRVKNSSARYTEEDLLTINAYSVEGSYVRFKFNNEKSKEIPYPLLGNTNIYDGDLEVRLQWRLMYNGTIRQIGIVENTTIGNSSVNNSDLTLKMECAMKIVQLGTPYYFVPNFPSISVISFLMALGQMSGRFLTVETKLQKVLRRWSMVTVTRFRSYQDFEDGKANPYDWSDYLVRSGGTVESMKFTLGEWAQRNTFAYKEGDSWEEKDSVDYFINNKALKTEAKAIELPFTAAISKDSQQTLYVPVYHYDEGNTTAVYDGADDKAYIAELSAGRLTATLGWKNLVGNYAPLFNALREMKVMQEKMRIPLPVLQTIDLYRPVYLRQYGCYFAIIEMRTRGDGEVDVELLKI